ncbi:MAG: RNA methyltransferase [Pirellulales bacterium]|nr:RNA methyltransferase [Pirellulales bacterium]
MTPITSPQNPRVKNAVRLRDRRHREKQGLTLIDGTRELQRAIDAGITLDEAFVCRPLLGGVEAERLLDALSQTGCEMFEVSEQVFAKLAFGDRHEGVLAVAETPRGTLDSISACWGGSSTATPTMNATAASSAPLVAVLEGVEKPGNLGAVLRSADGAGLSALIAADPRTDLYNPNAVRASLGTIFTVPVREAAGGEALRWLRANGFRIVAARVDGAVDYTSVDFRGPTAIVLGNEAEGLSPLWQGDDIQAVRLPMLGAADSLNVSAAAAVLFYEALRQRML